MLYTYNCSSEFFESHDNLQYYDGKFCCSVVFLSYVYDYEESSRIFEMSWRKEWIPTSSSSRISTICDYCVAILLRAEGLKRENVRLPMPSSSYRNLFVHFYPVGCLI